MVEPLLVGAYIIAAIVFLAAGLSILYVWVETLRLAVGALRLARDRFA